MLVSPKDHVLIRPLLNEVDLLLLLFQCLKEVVLNFDLLYGLESSSVLKCPLAGNVNTFAWFIDTIGETGFCIQKLGLLTDRIDMLIYLLSNIVAL